PPFQSSALLAHLVASTPIIGAGEEASLEVVGYGSSRGAGGVPSHSQFSQCGRGGGEVDSPELVRQGSSHRAGVPSQCGRGGGQDGSAELVTQGYSRGLGVQSQVLRTLSDSA
uniref:Uncharacterized protein n=1 Tax=Aegilops tauschii subsp. strangulata TaxID=200361 RepID=A0A453RWS8_AEGTS